jgi:2-polyprenyl-3-methyl-5-hydroxy-6-metoxy-1,4-benzoquinol methylase
MPTQPFGGSRNASEHLADPPIGIAQDDLKRSLVEVWDGDAAGYDVSPGHGLQDARAENVWRAAIADVLGDACQGGAPQLRVLDVGTGTGVVAQLAARLGHAVTAIDLSPNMLARGISRAREQGLRVDFGIGDAEAPAFAEGSFDVVISRHVLWTLPHPEAAATRWAALVMPGGLVAVFDVYHPRLVLPRRALGVLAERLDVSGRRQSGGHHYTQQMRAGLPLAVQRDASAGERVLRSAGLQDVRVRRLRQIDAAERAILRPLQRLGRPYLHYLATGRRAV